MKKTNAINLISSLTAATILAVIVGCASKGNYQQGAATGAGLTDASGKIADGSTKIDTVLASLNDLANNPQGDLVPKYQKFNDSVSDLQAMTDDVKKRFTDARVKGNDYFKSWDEQIATIRNQDIKNASTQREAAMQSQYDALKRGYAQVQVDLSPFMSDLKDIQTALGNDLTVGGVNSIKGAVDKTNSDGNALKTSLTQLSGQFSDLGAAMSSSVPASQPMGTNQMNQ